MKKQYVVFGVGKFGHSVAVTLQNCGCDVIAVDKDPELIQSISDEVSYAICADVENPGIFQEIGLKNVDAVVVALTDSLEASIVTTMTCREMGIKRIVAKAKSEMHKKILKSVGATDIVFPEEEMGYRTARHLVADNFYDWIELSREYSIVEMKIPAAWAGRSLLKLQLRDKYGINVIGLKNGDDVQMNLNPNAELPSKGMMIVIGPNKALEALEE